MVDANIIQKKNKQINVFEDAHAYWIKNVSLYDKDIFFVKECIFIRQRMVTKLMT